MKKEFRIGTRESELALWQANLIKNMLLEVGYTSTLVLIKSEGDVDLQTPLYEMGVQGIFTRSLDIALLNDSIDIAVHSMKDVPTMIPNGISQGAVIKRGNYRDLFIVNDKKYHGRKPPHGSFSPLRLSGDYDLMGDDLHSVATIATGSIRRKAQWLHRFPDHQIVNLRGNVNTRIQKIGDSDWDGAIMAAAGVERINIRPASAVELDWMLPAPAQGAVLAVCKSGDTESLEALQKLNDPDTEIAVNIEREFLRALMGGCSTPISALAIADKKEVFFRGSILSTDGKSKIEIEKQVSKNNLVGFGLKMGVDILKDGGQEILNQFKNG
ncbi:MAG: hydroxymethylbilane synthase [Ferruginibacter sp.]